METKDNSSSSGLFDDKTSSEDVVKFQSKERKNDIISTKKMTKQSESVLSIDVIDVASIDLKQSEENPKEEDADNMQGNKRSFGNKERFFKKNFHRDKKYHISQHSYCNEDSENLDLPYPIVKEKTIVVSDLRAKDIEELTQIADQYGVQNSYKMIKQDIVTAILRECTAQEKLVYATGVVEILNDGSGFMRCPENNYINTAEDAFIPAVSIKRLGIRFGDVVAGYIRPPRKNEKYFSLQKLTEINGNVAEKRTKKINFDSLTPLYPKEKLNFEMLDREKSVSTRIIDLVSPIGKGQRALIVSSPKSGKTILLQNIAQAINANHPEVDLIYLGIDERPEEFTEMQRTIKGEVVSSTFDQPAQRHVALAEIIIEKAKRMVEQGRDVVILLDSITRLARAYNNALPSSGKILSGGVDSNALHRPKRFFGAARNIENGGSLTIIATALIETGSKMDEVIFEEFKGTGNSEIVLDRKFADKRIFPAIDVLKSGTRKEDEMIAPEVLSKMWMLRRIIDGMGSGNEAIEFLIRKIKETSDNKEFFVKMNSAS